MGKFGFGNTSFKKKMASFKKDKEAFAAKKAEEEASKATEAVSDVPDEVVTNAVEEVKEVADESANDLKWKLFMAALKNKLSCCWGGAEESKTTFL